MIVNAVSADGMSVFAGRMARGSSACALDSPLISTPPLGATGARVDIGLATNLSNLVFFFPDSLQFHTLLWGDGGQVQSRPRAVVLVDAASAAAMPADPVTVLESGNGPFATDVRIGARTMLLFDVEPTPNGAAAKLEEAGSAGVCADFAGSLKGDGVPWSVRALHGLVEPVFAPQPAGRESWVGSSQLELIVGADDHSDAELPKRLEGAPGQPRKATP